MVVGVPVLKHFRVVFICCRFEFSLTPQELPNHSLEITVKNDKSMFSSSQSELGVIEVPLSQLDTSKALTEWWVSQISLTLLHSERPKLHTILAFLSAIGVNLKVPKSSDKICFGKI